DHLEPYPAIVDQHLVPGGNGGMHLRMQERHAPAVARARVAVEADDGSGLQHLLAARQRADADLGTLQVLQHGDRTSDLALDGPDGVKARRVVLVAAMTEVETEHVHAGVEELADPGRVRACRPERCNDLGSPIAPHVSTSLVAFSSWRCARHPE